jgi:hypothetical protein
MNRICLPFSVLIAFTNPTILKSSTSCFHRLDVHDVHSACTVPFRIPSAPSTPSHWNKATAKPGAAASSSSSLNLNTTPKLSVYNPNTSKITYSLLEAMSSQRWYQPGATPSNIAYSTGGGPTPSNIAYSTGGGATPSNVALTTGYTRQWSMFGGSRAGWDNSESSSET